MNDLKKGLVLKSTSERPTEVDTSVVLCKAGGAIQAGADVAGPLADQTGAELDGIHGDLGPNQAPTLVQVAVQNFPWAMLLVSTGSPYSS